MSREPCHIDGCEKESAGHGLCSMHWRRWRQHGDPYWVTPWDQRATTRKAWGCEVDDCDRPHHAKGFCDSHQGRRRTGDLRPAIPEKEGRPAKGGVPGYDAAHRRVYRDRGPAAALTCVDCGEQAREWSYSGADPDELTTRPDLRNEHPGLRYSLKSEFYEPRCICCHRSKDDSLAHSGLRNSKGQFMRPDPPGALITVEDLL
jgi:hypothetical protein